ncbi:MAG: hypothetical protein E6G40_11090 [Actinobacteria bacterium]|nr:MAG: hypothetical protein E6G40_11090 [Actinomycetota bacterium]
MRGRRPLGRRAVFFWVATLVCVAMVPAMPPELRWVAWATAGIGFFWAVLLSLEDLLGPGEPPAFRFPPVVPEMPFPPPPPPGGPRD